MRIARFGALALVAGLLVSCGGGNTNGGTGAPFVPSVLTVNSDPTGDTFGVVTKFDILQVETSRATTGATSLQVAIFFAQPVNLPAPGSSATSLQNATLLAFNTTGSGTVVNLCTGGAPAAGYPNVLFVVDPGTTGFYATSKRQADGGYLVLNWPSLTSTGTEASVSVNGNTLVYTIPLSALGGGTGATQMGIVAGNGSSPTDCAPNAGTIAT